MKSTTESAVRRRAKARGLKLEKSCSRQKEWPGYRTFHVADPCTNTVVFFRNSENTFGATLEECARYIDGHHGSITKA
jgi:hypothetical protein